MSVTRRAREVSHCGLYAEPPGQAVCAIKHAAPLPDTMVRWAPRFALGAVSAVLNPLVGQGLWAPRRTVSPSADEGMRVSGTRSGDWRRFDPTGGAVFENTGNRRSLDAAAITALFDQLGNPCARSSSCSASGGQWTARRSRRG